MTLEEFFVIREEWNRYRLLPENISLRIRISLVSVNFEGDKVHVEISQIMKKPPIPEDKGPPSENQSIAEKDILKEMQFERVFESLNIYDIPKMRKLLMVKPILESYSMTKKFDAKGDRFYQSKFRLAVAPINYPPEASEAISGSKS